MSPYCTFLSAQRMYNSPLTLSRKPRKFYMTGILKLMFIQKMIIGSPIIISAYLFLVFFTSVTHSTTATIKKRIGNTNVAAPLLV